MLCCLFIQYIKLLLVILPLKLIKQHYLRFARLAAAFL